jgi:predicted aspartyl protease
MGASMRDHCNLAFAAGLIAALFTVAPMTALGAECSQQKLVASVDLTLPPDGVPLAPVTLAGKSKLMIVDTGGYVGVLFPAAVRQLGLRTGVAATGIVFANGRTSNITAQVPDFAISRLHAPGYRFMVQLGQDAGDIPDDEPSGIISPDILQNYDVDFDFGGSQLNLIDPDHCKGKVIYWPASSAAIIPFRLDKSFHIIFPVTVDGRKLNAMLDTGASVTVMNLNSAMSLFRVDVKAPDVEKVGVLKGESYTADIYRRRFKTIAFDGVVISDPAITLMPDMMKAHLPQDRTPIGSMIPDYNQPTGLEDLTLGMATLAKLHVYIAYQERKIYITPAVPPQ